MWGESPVICARKEVRAKACKDRRAKQPRTRANKTKKKENAHNSLASNRARSGNRGWARGTSRESRHLSTQRLVVFAVGGGGARCHPAGHCAGGTCGCATAGLVRLAGSRLDGLGLRQADQPWRGKDAELHVRHRRGWEGEKLPPSRGHTHAVENRRRVVDARRVRTGHVDPSAALESVGVHTAKMRNKERGGVRRGEAELEGHALVGVRRRPLQEGCVCKRGRVRDRAGSIKPDLGAVAHGDDGPVHRRAPAVGCQGLLRRSGHRERLHRVRDAGELLRLLEDVDVQLVARRALSAVREVLAVGGAVSGAAPLLLAHAAAEGGHAALDAHVVPRVVVARHAEGAGRSCDRLGRPAAARRAHVGVGGQRVRVRLCQRGDAPLSVRLLAFLPRQLLRVDVELRAPVALQTPLLAGEEAAPPLPPRCVDVRPPLLLARAAAEGHKTLHDTHVVPRVVLARRVASLGNR
eukprot:Rhum_TRINITY_DN14606_c3_g2::Rhum_TRINITY_DN14606_c3_g2_i1::g.104114::m.104114